MTGFDLPVPTPDPGDDGTRTNHPAGGAGAGMPSGDRAPVVDPAKDESQVGSNRLSGSDELARFAACVWEPTDIVELRCLGRGRKTVSAWTTAAEFSSQFERLAKGNAAGWNIYAGAAPRRFRGATQAAGVALIRCLFVDLDHCTLEDAMARLETSGLPRPTMIVSSGHGVHLWWRLSAPIPPEEFSSARSDFDTLAVLLDGDRKVKDAPRIMRVPGFNNVKDPAAPVPCYIYEADADRRYDLGAFAIGIRSGQHRKRAMAAALAGPIRSKERQKALSRRTREFLRDGASEGERNDRLFQAACDLAAHGWTRDAAEAELVRAATACGLTDAEARATIESAFSKPRSAATAPIGRNAALPDIQVNDRQLRDVIEDAWNAIGKFNQTGPHLFHRCGHLIRITQRANGPEIELESPVTMYGLLARFANWFRNTEDGAKSCSPNRDVAADMLVNPRRDLPPLDGLIFAPTFGANFQIIEKPGYYAEHRVAFCRHGALHVAPVSPKPTPSEVDAARRLIVDDLLGDFAFVGAADRAHTIAAVLLPFARRFIAGVTPMHGVEAPTPGSGKGLLCNVICIIATGSTCEARTIPEAEEEIRKRITAELVAARPVTLLDNQSADNRLNSPTLASVLTAEFWTDRLLGHTKMLTLRNQTLWLLTGNNPKYSMEIARRCVRIRIDPRSDHPWKRSNFRHANLLEWALENRSRLVHAALTIIQNWIARGRPAGTRTLGSYECWARAMGGILDAAGVPGFLSNTDDLYESVDAEGGAWREFTAAWWREFGSAAKSPSEIEAICERRDLMTDARGNGNQRSRVTRLGQALKAARDRVFGSFRIACAVDDDRGRRYRLEVVGESDDAGPSGTSSKRGPMSQATHSTGTCECSGTLGTLSSEFPEIGETGGNIAGADGAGIADARGSSPSRDQVDQGTVVPYVPVQSVNECEVGLSDAGPVPPDVPTGSLKVPEDDTGPDIEDSRDPNVDADDTGEPEADDE